VARFGYLLGEERRWMELETLEALEAGIARP